MLLDITRVSDVSASPDDAWALLRDVPRFSSCVPSVSDVREIESQRRYSAVVSDKLGPFKLQVPVEIDVHWVEADRQITADVAGNDSKGQARIKGALTGHVQAVPGGSRLAFGMHIEVLGKLATLGAIPIRRRADDIFTEFAARVKTELNAADAVAP
jgi:carbon monoxide dehydrogenase subunit G